MIGFTNGNRNELSREECKDVETAKNCLKWKNKGFCDGLWMEMRCAKTCDKCEDGTTEAPAPPSPPSPIDVRN